MKNTKLILRTVIALCVVMLVLALPTVIQLQQAQLPAVQTGGSITLQPPAFFKTAYAQDAEQAACTPDLLSDAGVMAYIDLQTELDVSNIASFDSIEEQTDQYIRGSFLPPGFETVPEYDDVAYVQMLVCSDGWLVAYLPKEQISSVLLEWTSYSHHRLKSTPLEDAIRKIAVELGVTIPPRPTGIITYFDVRYPHATDIILVADSIEEDHATWLEDFQITIPKQFFIYEFAWSHAKDGNIQSECILNKDSLSTLSGSSSWRRQTKALVNPMTLAGKTHTFVLNQSSNGSSFCGVAIVYGKAIQ